MQNVSQIAIYCLALVLGTIGVGKFLARVFQGDLPFESAFYRLSGIDPTKEMNWRNYAVHLLVFNLLGFVIVFALQLFQASLPLNPQHFPNVPWPLALNTAISFTTNTNWQSYAGETTLSYLAQMLGLTVQNFLSAATGLCVLLALIRGIRRTSTDEIGNFWVDLVRSTVYVLLPLSFVLALLFLSQGVIQTFLPYREIITLEGLKQILPLGPVASQVAIKQLGTNGGGFFNANGAHPFENPTPFTNFLQMSSILLIPTASTYLYGRWIKSRREGWILFGTMFVVWFVGLLISLHFEGMLMEGKEQRFGVVNSLIWSTATTAASNGSVNAMHSSLAPLSGGIALFNIMVGEIIFGGIGVGLCGMILFVLLTVFLAGLMVGRTPEYQGKKIEAQEMKWVMLAILVPATLILLGSSLAFVMPHALESLLHRGPHGFSEILYAYTSAAGNNGSAFAGLNANTNFYNLTLAACMLTARLAILIPTLAIAGSLAKKKFIPPSPGTFRTSGLLFPILLLGVILIVGALTFFPALLLGPIVEHFLALKGAVY